MTRPTHETVAGARYLALRAVAKKTGRSTAELLQLYALEGFLSRLASSPHRQRLVLKGGVLLAAMDARRPTRDIDVLALRTSNEVGAVRALVHDVALVPLDDGLVFEPGEAEAIREGDAYAGVRVGVRGTLASAQLAFHVDVNVGDPVWPSPVPVQLPRLLEDEPIDLLGYPLSMVLAEKIVTALQRGTANTRWRDFADVYLLAQRHMLVGSELQRAVGEVAAFRQVPLTPIHQVLLGFAELGQSRWVVWRRNQGLDVRLPERLADVVTLVTRVADPVVLQAAGEYCWRPDALAWEQALSAHQKELDGAD